MNLLHAWKTLIEAGQPLDASLELSPTEDAIADLLTYAWEHERLRTTHPWELDPAECRELDRRFGYTPPGTWSRLAGLAAGADVLHATMEGFMPVPTLDEFRGAPADAWRRRMLESFTRRLIPPAAAAALYVALEVHPVWGLRLGRQVGAFSSPTEPGPVGAALGKVDELVFGTIATLIATLRGLRNDRRYPIDALGDVLWAAALGARGVTHPDDQLEPVFPPTFVAPSDADERRMLTTRMSIVDIFDYVLVPAGVGRRDDAGFFRVDPAALLDVGVGSYDVPQQESWLSRLLWGEGSRRAC